MPRTTIYLTDEVDRLIARVVAGSHHSRGRVSPGRMTTSGFIRFALTSWNEIIDNSDHGLNAREVAFIGSVITPYMRGDGEMPFNPVLSARVRVAKSSLIAHGVDSRELAQKLDKLDIAQQCKLFVEIAIQNA